MADYLLAIVPKNPLFSKEELDRISSILEGTGQVLFASIVIPSLFRLDSIPTTDVLLASEATIFSWFLSIWLARKASLL